MSKYGNLNLFSKPHILIVTNYKVLLSGIFQYNYGHQMWHCYIYHCSFFDLPGSQSHHPPTDPTGNPSTRAL